MKVTETIFFKDFIGFLRATAEFAVNHRFLFRIHLGHSVLEFTQGDEGCALDMADIPFVRLSDIQELNLRSDRACSLRPAGVISTTLSLCASET